MSDQQTATRITAQTFIDALWHLEETCDVEPMAALYGADASISNPLVSLKHQGSDGARRFWTTYRASFKTIKSEFSHVLDGGDVAIMEWTSRGTGPDGAFEYRGVSVVEHNGEAITAFRTYFDPRRLGEELAEHPGAGSR